MKSIHIKSTVLTGVFAFALAGFAGVAAAQDKVKLKVAHFLPPMSTAQKKLIEPWAKEVEEKSGGRIEVEIYPAMQLGGKPPQLFDQVRTGVADVVWTLPGYTPGRFPKTEVFELPFVTGKTAEATSQAVMDVYDKHLKDEYKDVKVLALFTHAPGAFHMKEGHAVQKMEDLKGLKIRLPTKPIGEALKALGATPVGMPVPEVYEALSRGVVDGTVIPFEVVRPLRVNELVKSHTDTGLYTSVFLYAMNKDKYDGLSADLKKVIDEASGMALAKKVGADWDEAEKPGIAQAKEMGHQFYELSPEETKRWKEATRPVVQDWIKRTPDGQQIYDDAVAAIEKYSKQ